MQIDRKMNLVLTVERDDGEKLYVHSAPIGYEVFKHHYLVLSKAWAKIGQEGDFYVAFSGPKVAALVIRDVARDVGGAGRTAEERSANGLAAVEAGLMAEIVRLSNVVFVGKAGWESYPLADAVRRKILSTEEFDEIEGAVTFFTVVSSMNKASETRLLLNPLTSLWGAQYVSLNATEFTSSLQTSTTDDSSGAKKAGSSAITLTV